MLLWCRSESSGPSGLPVWEQRGSRWRCGVHHKQEALWAETRQSSQEEDFSCMHSVRLLAVKNEYRTFNLCLLWCVLSFLPKNFTCMYRTSENEMKSVWIVFRKPCLRLKEKRKVLLQMRKLLFSFIFNFISLLFALGMKVGRRWISRPPGGAASVFWHVAGCEQGAATCVCVFCR